MKQEKMDIESIELGKLIKQVKKPVFSINKKELLKKQIMSRASKPSFSWLKELVSKVVLSPDRKFILKERVMAAIEEHSQKSFFFANFFLFQKRFVSAMLLFAMVLGVFSFGSLEIGVVHADSFTTLTDFTGEVFVERDGRSVELERGMRIFENDKIRTGEDGFVSIIFFDDSVSRLSSETEVLVTTLDQSDSSLSKSYVEISLENGEVWSRVVNLVEGKSAFVVEADKVKTTAKRAAFNIAVDSEAVEVEVFNHAVEVESDFASETVISGRKLMSTEERVEVRDLDEDAREVAWVKDNLDSDKLYLTEVEERLFAAKMESVGVDFDEDFDYKASLAEEAIVFLTLGDVNRKKKELDLVEKAFIEAEIKLNDETVTEDQKIEAENMILAFKTAVVEFNEMVAEVEMTDTGYAEELDEYVEDKILTQKKTLSLILPESPSYFAKQVIQDLELDVIADEKELIEKTTQQGLDKVSEAEDIIDREGDVELAKEVLEEGKEKVEGASELVDNLEDVEKKSVVRDFEDEVDKTLDRVDVVEEKVADVELQNSPFPLDEATVKSSLRVVSPEVKIDEVYGVKIEGDKLLDPLLY